MKRRDRRQEVSPANIFITAEGRLCSMFGVVLQCVDRTVHVCAIWRSWGGWGRGNLIVTAEGYYWLKKVVHDAEVTD